MTDEKGDRSKLIFDEDFFILGNTRHYIDDLPVRFRTATCAYLDLSIATYYRRSSVILDMNNAKKAYRGQLSASDQMAVYQIFRAFADEFNAFARYIKPKNRKARSKLPKGFNKQY